ncbi:MAG: hypothetical protein KA319_12425, partial [Ferruginibacter sp.]|nr:hypothetical protein [Ferruginibacter sp.]
MKILQIAAITVLLTTFSIFKTVAQMPGMGGRSGGGQSMNVGRFYGKIVDNNNKAIEFASVQLIQNKMDTATKKRKDIVVSGMLTDKKGEFSLDNLNVMA